LFFEGGFLEGTGVWIYLNNSTSWNEVKQKQVLDNQEDLRVRINLDKLEKIVARGRTVEGKFLYGGGMI
jgi:hypothetical protein